jgi:FkbM family methyltransferase
MSIINTDTEKCICIDGNIFYEDGDIANATLTRELLGQYKNPFCCDIGCDKGWWSRWVAFHSPNAVIHCFEPNNKSYTYLQKEFINRNQITVHPFAISSKNSILKLTNEAGRSNSRNIEYESNYDEVECKRLDSLFSPETHFTLLKIDTEGHDIIILESLIPLLQKGQIDNIISEFTVYWVAPTFDKIIDIILPIFLDILEVMPNLYLLSRSDDYIIGPITQDSLSKCIYILNKLRLQTDIWLSRELPPISMNIISFKDYYKLLEEGCY